MKTKHFLLIVGVLLAVFTFAFESNATGGGVMLGNMVLAGQPQDKILKMANKFGIRNLANQQATTRIIYDSIAAPAQADTLYFFRNVNTRQFPLSNMGASGNQMQAGEAMTLLFAYLSILQKETDEQGVVTWQVLPINALAGAENLEPAEIDIMIANTMVTKPIPVASFLPAHNRAGFNEDCEVFQFMTAITINPLQEFEVRLRLPGGLVAAEDSEWYVRLTLEGVGTILSPKTSM